MCRKVLLLLAAGILLFTQPVFGGGPPLLCVPVDGVTADSSERLAELLATKLDTKLFPDAGAYSDVEIREHNGQWYAMLYMREDVALSEIDSALKDTEFSIPRDKLRFFGHVVLEIDASDASAKSLQNQLEEMEYVSVVESDVNEGRLHVTVEMPYPSPDDRQHRDAILNEKFTWNGYTTDSSGESQAPAAPQMLPVFKAFDETIARHGAKLQDVRWSTQFACRAVGCVAAPNEERLTSAKRSVIVAQ